MIDKKIDFRKKREFGEIIIDSFTFLKQEFQPISRVVLIYVIPFILVYSVLQIKLQQKLIGSEIFINPESIIENLESLYPNVFVILFFNLFVQALFISVIYSYIEVYVKKGKEDFNLSEVKSLLFSNSLLALGASLILYLIITIGLVMCILPGIFFGNTFSLILIIFLFEKKGLNNALTKSWNMVIPNWWNTFLLNLLALVLIWIISFIITIPASVSGLTNNIANIAQDQSTELPDWYWIMTGINSVISSLLYIIPYTFLAFQYFNLEERYKEQTKPPVQF